MQPRYKTRIETVRGRGAAVGRRQEGQGQGGLGSVSRKGITLVAADD